MLDQFRLLKCDGIVVLTCFVDSISMQIGEQVPSLPVMQFGRWSLSK
jgi:hypothetical protein